MRRLKATTAKKIKSKTTTITIDKALPLLASCKTTTITIQQIHGRLKANNKKAKSKLSNIKKQKANIKKQKAESNQEIIKQQID